MCIPVIKILNNLSLDYAPPKTSKKILCQLFILMNTDFVIYKGRLIFVSKHKRITFKETFLMVNN